MRTVVLVVTIAASFVFASASMVAEPVLAIADASTSQACDTIRDINPNSTSCGASNGQVSGIISLALNLLSIIAGIIAVIMIIVSGLKYITSSGDANQISSAKKSLIYAIVGIVVVAVAQVIVQFVIKRTL